MIINNFNTCIKGKKNSQTLVSDVDREIPTLGSTEIVSSPALSVYPRVRTFMSTSETNDRFYSIQVKMAEAKGSSNVSEKIRRHLTCSICLDVFVSPKTLPCLHTFCHTCLREYIGRGILSNPGEKQYFECPLCRSKTYAKDNSDTKNWVEDFPSNHFIVSMIDDG